MIVILPPGFDERVIQRRARPRESHRDPVVVVLEQFTFAARTGIATRADEPVHSDGGHAAQVCVCSLRLPPWAAASNAHTVDCRYSGKGKLRPAGLTGPTIGLNF